MMSQQGGLQVWPQGKLPVATSGSDIQDKQTNQSDRVLDVRRAAKRDVRETTRQSLFRAKQEIEMNAVVHRSSALLWLGNDGGALHSA